MSSTINPNLPFNFNYDQNHNWLLKAKSDLSLQSTYQYQQNSNRLSVQETLQQGNTPLPTIANRQFVYNDVGRLFQLIKNGTLKAEYIYNDAGLRTRKTTYLSDGITIDKRTIYHYDQMGYLVTETTEAGVLVKDYIWQEGMTPLAQIDNILGIESVSYLYTDHLMTNRLATDNNQSIIWQWEGEAFGNTPATPLVGINVNLRFPGQYYDQETNLHYNHFRYYDPSLGRYITSDPIGLQGGLNTYNYVFSNAIRLYDFDGLRTSGQRPNNGFNNQGWNSRSGFGNPHGVPIIRNDYKPPVRHTEPTAQSPFRPNPKHNHNIIREHINNIPGNNTRADRTGPPDRRAGDEWQLPEQFEYLPFTPRIPEELLPGFCKSNPFHPNCYDKRCQ